MAATVYLLCTGTALLCAVLLFRGYRRSRVRLLFWSGLCFALLTLDNFLFFFEKIIFTSVDLSDLWSPVGLAAVAVLLYGLIWKENP